MIVRHFRSIGVVMETRKLEAFIAVARELHFGRAAETLHRGQSSVSDDVRSLEREVGGALFVRTSRRVALTDLGRSLLADAEPAVAALAVAMQQARRIARGERNEIRVGYLGGGFYEFTGPVLAEFARARPDVELTFVETDYLSQIESVRSGAVDVALVRLPVGLPELRRGAILFRDQRMLAIPEGHRLCGRSLVDPEELQHEAMVHLPEGACPPAWEAYHFPTMTPQGRPIARGPIIRSVRDGLAAVAAGGAVMTISARAQRYFQHPGVVFADIDLPPVQSALVSRAFDQRSVIRDLDVACQAVMDRMAALVTRETTFVPA